MGKVPHFRPFSLPLVVALLRPLKIRFSFPNGCPNGFKTTSGRLLEATASDNLILHWSKQDFHRFSVHTKAWNQLKPEGILKILPVRHFGISSFTNQNRSKSFPKRSWKHMLPWTWLLVPSELDLDFKIAPKIRSKIGPKSISRGILARNFGGLWDVFKPVFKACWLPDNFYLLLLNS